jgi:hypothetical protein
MTNIIDAFAQAIERGIANVTDNLLRMRSLSLKNGQHASSTIYCPNENHPIKMQIYGLNKDENGEESYFVIFTKTIVTHKDLLQPDECFTTDEFMSLINANTLNEEIYPKGNRSFTGLDYKELCKLLKLASYINMSCYTKTVAQNILFHPM